MERQEYAKYIITGVIVLFAFILAGLTIGTALYGYIIQENSKPITKEVVKFKVSDMSYVEPISISVEEIIEEVSVEDNNDNIMEFYSDEFSNKPNDIFDEISYTTDCENALTKSAGVNMYNGRKETWYSSNILYHYRTSEWSIDENGVYRDSDGYVVVAASDLSQGSIIETSHGLGKVYDSGCAYGVTDIYTAW